jgi:hypothetical protein
MEAKVSIPISMDDLRTLIKELISEYMLNRIDKNKASKSDLFSTVEILEKLYIRPQRLEEWKEMGLITEYKVGNVSKFKLSELFAAIEQFTKAYKEQKELREEKEVQV